MKKQYDVAAYIWPSYHHEPRVEHFWPEKDGAWLDARPRQTPLLTFNSWNEWTEGSYLLPDMRWGCSYLRAVRNVFG